MFSIKTILVIKLAALGDVVRTSFFLSGLCKKYSKAKIYWLTQKNAIDILKYNPLIFSVITPDRVAEIVPVHFDLIISCDEDKTAMQALSGLKCSDLIGVYVDKSCHIVYTRNSAKWFDMSLISRFGKARADELKKKNKKAHHEIWARILDINVGNPPFLYNSKAFEKRMCQKFSAEYFNIGLNSAAGNRWPAKSLPIDEVIALIRKLLKLRINNKPVRIYLLGGPDETGRHKTLKEVFPHESVVDSGNNNSLLEFTAIIKCCDYIISSDSLALHLAIGQGRPNLSFFAPTSAAEIGTFALGVKVVSRKPDYCTYKKNVDVSDITADRLYGAFKKHVKSLGI